MMLSSEGDTSPSGGANGGGKGAKGKDTPAGALAASPADALAASPADALAALVDTLAAPADALAALVDTLAAPAGAKGATLS